VKKKKNDDGISDALAGALVCLAATGDVITQITPVQRRIIVALCEIANMPRSASDGLRLRKLARNAGPRHVEAWMLTTNRDIMGLDPKAFLHEMLVALYCIEEKGEAESEALAERRGVPQIGVGGDA
jgi:hypothetical protein